MFIKNNNKKTKEIKIRCTEVLLGKLMAICEETGKTKTDQITDLINAEYKKNKAYERRFYANLEEK